MNVIFLTMPRFSDITVRGIYQDLIRKMRDEGHDVCVVTSHQRSLGLPTELIQKDGIRILGVKTLNLQKTNIIEKGIGQVLLECQFKKAIKKHLNGTYFDLILYTTPPITFTNVVKFLKKINPNAISYLLLKDIFPQNAVDIGMMSTTGLRGVLYKYFRKKEKKLYGISDYIGCMSQANVNYVLANNPEVSPNKVELAPNSIELLPESSVYVDQKKQHAKKDDMRLKYCLPPDKPIFIYGGNLGRPQGIPFLIDCLNENAEREDCFFLIIGSGTELPRLKQWYAEKHPKNLKVMDGLPTAEYDELVRTCDVGMIFLDHRFTIPNFPSRLLSYLENKIPVLCATDPNTDIGRIAEDNGFGFWCESNSVEAFTAILDRIIHSDRLKMGEKGYDFLKYNYTVDNTYHTIIRHFEVD